MKINHHAWFGPAAVETIAVFGAARLVKKPDGRHELLGGTADDHAAACEWCSLFAHEVVFSRPNRRSSAIVFAE